MALTADQRAMLQLLLERDQSYEDLAALLEASREEVRRRAREALAELAGEDPDAEVALSDYLLGQADPIGRADAVRHLQADREALRLARRLATKLQLLAPGAELPELPSARAPQRRLPRPHLPSRLSPARAGLSQRQARIFVALGASAVLVVAIVLAVAGVFDEDASTTPATESNGGDIGDIGEELTRVQFQPRGETEAGGQAIFGLATNDQPYLHVQIELLQPPPEGSTYVVWFLLTPRRGYPLAPLAPQANGSVQSRFAIPQAVLPIAARTRFVDVSLVDNRQLAGDLQEAIEGSNVLLRHQGETMLRGEILEAEGDGA